MASNNIQEELQTLKSDISQLRADIQGLMGLVKEEGVSRVNDAKHYLEDELDGQRERIRETFNRAKECGKGTADEVERQIAEHPVGSLLTAFGIGYILAKLSGGK